MADNREQVDAALTRLERDEAVANADNAQLDRDVAIGQAASAARWGAEQAAERADAEAQAIHSEAHAQTNAAALWIVVGVLVLLLLGWLAWYLQHQSAPTSSTTVIDRTTTVPTSSGNAGTVIPVPAAAPLPAAAPAQQSAPASQPSAGSGTSGGSQTQAAPAPIIINNNIPAPSQPESSSASNIAPSSSSSNGYAPPSSVDNGSGPSSIDNGSGPSSVNSPATTGNGSDSDTAAPAGTAAANGQ